MCVSVPNGGFNFIELMSKTINRTISGLHEISLRFTCHDSSQESMIKDSCNGISISGSHIIERTQNNFIHSNSVTHSRCIETMYQATQADVCLICDYDCIPVRKNWDEEIARQINKENVILLGSPYSELPLNLYGGVPAYKYQRQPNAIFLAINLLVNNYFESMDERLLSLLIEELFYESLLLLLSFLMLYFSNSGFYTGYLFL